MEHAHTMTDQHWSLPQADKYFGPILAADPRGFEIDHLDLALRHCNQFRVAVDGGAHVGTWTRAMAQRFFTVMAFEPAPDSFECLIRNTGYPNVQRLRLALGAVQTTANVMDDPVRPGNTGARHLHMIGMGGEVSVVPLDGFMLAHLDFLKLDVEGYELQALWGAEQTLRRCRPVVMIECKRFKPPRFGVDHETAPRYLIGCGYREVARAKNDRVFVPC